MRDERRKDKREDDRTVDHGSLLLCDLRQRHAPERNTIRELFAKEHHRFGALGFRLHGVGSIHRRADAWRAAIHGSLRTAEIRAFQMALQSGLTAEFGVFQGESINYIASVLPGRTIHGFDSFEGNPEDSKDFLNWKKGTFDLGGKSTTLCHAKAAHYFIKDQNDSFCGAEVANCLKKLRISRYASHISGNRLDKDCSDLTAIFFDEFFNYPGWKRGESKAFAEMIAARGLKFEYLGYSDQQVAVKIL